MASGYHIGQYRCNPLLTMLYLSILLPNTIKGIARQAQTAQTLPVQVIKTPMLGEMSGVLPSLISQLNITAPLTLP